MRPQLIFALLAVLTISAFATAPSQPFTPGTYVASIPALNPISLTLVSPIRQLPVALNSSTIVILAGGFDWLMINNYFETFQPFNQITLTTEGHFACTPDHKLLSTFQFVNQTGPAPISNENWTTYYTGASVAMGPYTAAVGWNIANHTTITIDGWLGDQWDFLYVNTQSTSSPLAFGC